MKYTVWKKYGYVWVTAFLFLFSLLGHWVFAWAAYKEEAKEHNQPIVMKDYVNQTMRDTLENWQSEFLQLIWQVAGLAFLLHVGSPQSKEGDDRKEEKLDLLIHATLGNEAKKEISRLDKKYPRS
jgi:hypothetical protein